MQQYLEAGKVVTTHGVRGEMKLELWCDGVNFLKKVGRLYASAQGGRAWKIVSIRAQGQMALLQLEGVNAFNVCLLCTLECFPVINKTLLYDIAPGTDIYPGAVHQFTLLYSIQVQQGFHLHLLLPDLMQSEHHHH